MPSNRFGQVATEPVCASGYALKTLVPATPLVGANGMRFGPDGRLYVAQAFGGQITAVDVATGAASVISPANGNIIAPDDLAFDSLGNLYATEVMSARVSARRLNGSIDVIAGNVPVANGIVVHNDRIYMSEFRPGGRVLEIFADGTPPRVIAENLMAPNALSMGPDGCLYFPLVPLGEIWRVRVEGGAPERVADGFAIPTAVKFDRDGTLVIVESGTGAITRFNLATGVRHTFARVAFGIDNLAFSAGGQLYVSHFTDGSVIEVSNDGSSRTLVEGGMLGPFGLAVTSSGDLVIADGMSIATVTPDGLVRRPAMLLEHGFPGYVRGIAVAADDVLVCTNSAGVVARYMPQGEAIPLAEGLHQAMGVAISASGEIFVCESGAGRVVGISPGGIMRTVADRLNWPTGICCTTDGGLMVTESGGGRAIKLKNGEQELIMDGLIEPHGIGELDGKSIILDRGSRKLYCVAPGNNEAVEIAGNIPVGTASDMKPNSLPGIADLMPGPLNAFADLVVASDGCIYVGCDANGSVVGITQERSAHR